MKKIWITICLAIASLVALFSLAACGADYSEVAGTYELQDLTGTINNVTMRTSMYSYYRIILDKNGKVTVQSKRKEAEEEEKTGTFTYSAEEGKIYITTKTGANTVTEEYTYTDGVIICKVDEHNRNYTITFAIEKDEG